MARLKSKIKLIIFGGTSSASGSGSSHAGPDLLLHNGTDHLLLHNGVDYLQIYGPGHAGPDLLLHNGTDHILLHNGVDYLQLRGVVVVSYIPTYYILGF